MFPMTHNGGGMENSCCSLQPRASFALAAIEKGTPRKDLDPAKEVEAGSRTAELQNECLRVCDGKPPAGRETRSENENPHHPRG